MFSIRHWEFTQILFVGAACFAMAAVGFFLAVYLQLRWGPGGLESSGTYTTSKLVPIEDKVATMQKVSATSPQPAIPEDQRNQGSPDDPLTAQKVKMLESMNRE